nr:RDD family protein [Pseudenhygromyxa sp. WMMC2535]
MPCPHCDGELPRELAAEPEPRCPHCGLPCVSAEVAGFWRRLAAGAIDLGLLALTAGPVSWAIHRVTHPLPLAPNARGIDLLLTVGATDLDVLLRRAGPFIVLAALYFMFMTLWTGQTLGQRVLAMRIIDRHGGRPGPVVAIVRTLAQVVGTLAAALGPLWIAFDSERRAFHDLVAGTYVVRSM